MTSKPDIHETLASRQLTHGSYLDNATITWAVMDSLSTGAHWDQLHPAMKESLHMIAHKMHRIVNGDPFFLDHWHDLEGYAALIPKNWDELLAWRAAQGGAAPVLETLPEPVGASPEPAADPADTTSAAPRATAGDSSQRFAINDRVYVTGWVGVREIVQHRGHGWWRVAEPGSRSFMDAHEDDLVLAREARIADAGGPIVLSHDIVEENGPELVVPMPSEVRREPICATAKEHELMGKDVVEHGSLRGVTWQSLYHQVPNADGRFDMLKENQDEYGR